MSRNVKLLILIIALLTLTPAIIALADCSNTNSGTYTSVEAYASFQARYVQGYANLKSSISGYWRATFTVIKDWKVIRVVNVTLPYYAIAVKYEAGPSLLGDAVRSVGIGVDTYVAPTPTSSLAFDAGTGVADTLTGICVYSTPYTNSVSHIITT
jgi:hypothetical protein